jgi:hypothetical protein
MNFVPNAAIAVTTGLLLAIGLCLAHMISSRRQDARLQFLLNLMQTLPAADDQSESPQLRGSRPDPPDRTVMGASFLASRHAARGGAPRPARLALRETPLLFAAALRGRGL